MAKKISRVLASQRDYLLRPFALWNHTHEFYANTVETLVARDAIEGDRRYEGVIYYVKEDSTTYQLRGGTDNSDWVVLVSALGATSHLDLTNIGTNTHAQIDSHIADATLHFTQAAISITESQISDLQAYALSSHDHDSTYLGITDTAAAADALSTTGASVDVSGAAPPVAGQILTATSPTTATWQNAAAAGVGDIIQTGSPADTYVGYFTADKNLSGDAGFTWTTAAARLNISGSSPELRLQDNDTVAASMAASLSFYGSDVIAAEIRMDGSGNLRIENAVGEIRFDTGTSDVVVSGNGDLSVGNDLDITGYITGYGGTPADLSVLQWNAGAGRAEFALGSVMAAGTPLAQEVAVYSAANEIQAYTNFTYSGTVLAVNGLEWDGTVDQLTLGDGDLSTPGIEINGDATATPYLNLSQAGTVRGIFRFSDGSDRVEISSTADDITLRPGNVDTVVVTQASTRFTSTLIDLDNSAAATATTIMARNSAGGMTFNINTTTGNAQLGQISGAGAAEDVWINFARNAGVTLRFDNAIKLATVTGGIDVTGAITVSGTVDGRDVDADGTAQDSHIADSTIHFTEASIDIPLSQGANDVTATFGELNLLDLAGLTAGWVLSADTATTASWKAPAAGSEINDLTVSVTWANVPDANITQSSVTQHEAALTIIEGQITGAAFTNWNTAFGWGDHDGLYAAAAHTHLLAAGATDVSATAAEVNLLDLAGLTVGWVLSADSATTASWKAPTGGSGSIGGSITDNQIAVGATTADDIEGDASFTWDGTTIDFGDGALTANSLLLSGAGPQIIFDENDAALDQGTWLFAHASETFVWSVARDSLLNNYTFMQVERSGTGASVQVDTIDFTAVTDVTINSALVVTGARLSVGSTAPLDTHLSTLETIEVGIQTVLYGANNTGGSHFMRGAYHNGTNWVKTVTGEEVSALSFLGTGNIKLRTATSGTAGDTVSWIDSLEVDNATGDLTMTGALLTSASTTTRAGFNIAEGVAPTTPVDGDLWITAAGAFNARLNGVTVDVSAGGGGIGGSITDNQIAVGATTADDIEGSSTFTWDATTLTIDSDAATTVRIEAGAASDARILFYQTFTQRGLLVYDTSETAMSLSCVSGDVKLRPANTDILTLNSATGAQLHNGGLRFLERGGNAHTPAATFGELWVRNDAPNVLVFTDDAGTDWDLNTAGGGETAFEDQFLLMGA